MQGTLFCAFYNHKLSMGIWRGYTGRLWSWLLKMYFYYHFISAGKLTSLEI
ncbi:hypothetical protein HMPREF3220_03976 [Citrobacter koseri]|nr:hypothetical protein HMPREF3220_03976 [Citrobacter koseri]KXA01243.1 hypothetical protein HMPREF3207_02986 [Citrobacter koseri]